MALWHVHVAFCLVALAFTSVAAPAPPTDEAGRSIITNFLPRDYKRHSQMWSATQAADGLLYFANRGAVLEFDGRTWSAIPVSNTFVHRVALAPDGHIYVCGPDLIGRLERKADRRFEFRSLLDLVPAEAKPLGAIASIAVHDGAVFFGSSVLLRWRDGAFRIWKPPVPGLNSVQAVGKHLFAIRPGEGLLRWTGDDFSPLQKLNQPQPAGSQAITLTAAYAEDPTADAVVFTSDGHAARIRGDRTERWELPAATAAVFSRLRPRVAVRLADGTLAVGTTTAGVFLLDAAGMILRRIDERSGLENQRVLGLFEDRERSLWVMTHNGAARIEVGTPATLFDRANGLGGEAVSTFVRHRDVLYAGSSGLYRLAPGDPVEGRPARFEKIPLGLGVGEGIESLRSHRDGLLIAGLTAVAWWRDGAAQPENVLKVPVAAYAIELTQEDPDFVFVGCASGLEFLRYREGRWQSGGKLAAFSADARSLVQDGPDSLWLGSNTRGFFHVVRAAGGDWTQARVTSYFGARGLPEGQGASHAVRGPRGVVFATQKGIWRYDAASDRFVRDPDFVRDGQPVKRLTSLVPDAGGGFWAETDLDGNTSSLRVGRYVPGPGGFTWQGQPRRLMQLIGWGSVRAVHWDKNAGGEALWVSGGEGTLRIDLGRPHPPVPKWKALIRVVRWPIPGFVPATSSAPRRFPFTREPFTVEFGADHHTTGPSLEFQTRLLGFDDKWSAWSTRSDATFTNLSGGPFTLEVRARTPDLGLSEPAGFTFSVTPPWHRRDWAIALYVGFGALAVGGFVRWRLRAGERERARLERLVSDRTAELRVAKEAADAASRAKSTFLANMSHELRTPLNGVIGYSQVIMKAPELSPKSREQLQVVQTSGEHLLRMINEVLDFSKIEAGKMELTTAPFHLPQLLADVAAAMNPRAQQKELGFVMEAAADLPDLVLGDSLKLRQVLDNLLGNAIKFTPAGSVRLTTQWGDNEHVQFSVSDTGVGLSEADRAKLFQPFQQATEGRPAEPGTGLGLAICRRLVEIMGGTLNVESEPGHGSRFHFTVPLPVLAADASTAPRTAGIVAGYQGRRRRLLVVDDVAINRHVLRDLLVPLGFEISEAPNGDEALAAMPTVRPDLVFLDLRMPGMDGLELARRLRAREGGAKLKIIATSASVLSFNREDAFAAGCDDFLPKPFREEDLLARLGLALQIEWTGAAAADGGARHNPDTPDRGLTRLTADDLRELLAIAQRGEIVALRRRLDAWSGDPLADTLHGFAKSYQMEKIREVLEQRVAPPSIVRP